MSYFWNANRMTPIGVDGEVGPATTKALQFGLGITADGEWGDGTTKALQEFLGASPYDGILGPLTIGDLQTRLGVTRDGVLGPETVTALQNALNGGTLGTTGAVAISGPAPISKSAVTYGRYTGSFSQASVVQQACAHNGVPYTPAWQNGFDTLCSRESSWDANAVNDYDLNANGPTVSDGYPENCSRGITQCIPQTFADNHAAGTSNDIYDPVASCAASQRYVMTDYGVSADGSDFAAKVQQADPNRPPRGY